MRLVRIRSATGVRAESPVKGRMDPGQHEDRIAHAEDAELRETGRCSRRSFIRVTSFLGLGWSREFGPIGGSLRRSPSVRVRKNNGVECNPPWVESLLISHPNSFTTNFPAPRPIAAGGTAGFAEERRAVSNGLDIFRSVSARDVRGPILSPCQFRGGTPALGARGDGLVAIDRVHG